MKAIAKNLFFKSVMILTMSFASIFSEAQCLTDGSNRISHNPAGINSSPPGPATSGNVLAFGQSFSYFFSGTRQIKNIVIFSKDSDFGESAAGVPILDLDVNIDVKLYQGEGFGGTLLYSSAETVSWPAEGPAYNNVDPSINIPIVDGPALNSGATYTFRVSQQLVSPKIGWNQNSNLYGNGNFVRGSDSVALSVVDLSFEIDFSFPIEIPTITESSNTLTSSAASSYQWIKDGIDINGATAQTLDVSNQEGSYQVRITNSNGCEGISESFTVDNKVPVFTSANTTTVQEGTTGTIYSASSTDLSQPITYSLANGVNDNNLFNINGADISFIMPPVFNQGGNNTYTLTVTATDAATNSSTLDVTVTVFRPLPPPNGDCETVLNFDGANEYVDFGNFSSGLDNGSALTISYFYKGTDLQSPIRIQSDDFLVAGWTGAGSQPDPLHILSWDGGTSGILVGNVNDNLWHHIAVTWEQGATDGFRSYLDGNLVDSKDAANVSIPTLSNNVFNIGSFQGFGEFITGALDEVSIWDRALTQSEIQDMGSNGINGNEPNLLHYYNFNETTGTALTDLKGSLNGTLTNMESLDWTDINGNAITPGSQSIINFSDITKTLGDTDFDLTAESDAGTEAQGFTITYQSSDPSVAAVSGKTVSIVSIGTTTITATQEGGLINGVCYDFVSTSQTLTVNKADQTITFNPLSAVAFGDADFSLSAAGGESGNPVTFASSDEAVATISDKTVTIVGAGTTTITASQGGDANYNAALDVDQVLTVDKADQTITFNALQSVTFGDADFDLTATSGASSNPVTFVSSDEMVATVSGSTVTIVGAGSTTITASQGGDANYNAAIDVDQLLTVNKADQTITFNPLSSITFGDADFDLTATGGASSNPVTFVSSDEMVATVSGSTVTIVGAGSTTITASQAGSVNYNAAIDVDQVLTVNKADQAITFNPLSSVTFGDADFDLTATGGASGNAVTYSSSDESVATISGSTVTIIGAGTTTITASQTGNVNYNAATDVDQVLTVNKAPQTITFSSLEEQNIVEGTTLEVTATGGVSGEPVTYASSNTAVATVNGSTVTLLAAGITTITANQTGNTNYEAATPVDQTLTVIEEYIWDGTSWNSGSTPPADVAIMIEADYTTSSHSTFEAANLEIAENITLTIDDQDAIVVNDDLIMDGNITLNSGGILALFGNTSGTGTVTTNRNVTPDLGYSMVGTTVGNVSVSALSASPDFFYGFDGTNFTIPTTLEAGKGYFVAYDSPAPLFAVAGTPTTGVVNVSPTYSNDGDATNDFNLLSNPYNAAIGRQSFVDNNTSIDGVTYYWQDGGSNLPSGSRSGNYVTVTANGTTTGGTFDGNIRSGQGFFVRATSSSTISFDPEDQVTDLTSNTDGGFFRTASTQMIRLTITDQTSEDEAVITFSENGTPSLDQGLDAYKFMNPGLSLYSLVGETALAIQALPEITEAVQIPLGYQTTASGEAQFSVDLSAFSSSEDIYLHDQLTGNKIDLRANPSPTFTLDNTQSQTRFVLEVSARLLSASQNLNASLLVYGSKESLTVKAADLSGGHLVQIHSLEGKLLYNQRVIFESGQAQLSPQIRMSGLYLLQVGGKQTKFITRD